MRKLESGRESSEKRVKVRERVVDTESKFT